MSTRTLTALAIALLLQAPSLFADDKDKKKDIDALQGTWNIEVFKTDGQAAPEESLKEMKFTIKDNKYTLTLKGEEMETGTLKLDPEKQVKTIDLEIQSGPDKGKKQVGIYTLKGDTFMFCFARPGETERPTKFESTEENKAIFSELKREKK
jgi:uncharacterized protein (TIGR03067 family)